MILTGTWEGAYHYPPEDYAELEHLWVPFRMSLADGDEQGFSGYVRDDATHGGAPDRGRIVRGNIKGRSVAFDKVIPINYFISEDGLIEAQELIETQFDVKIEGDMPPHTVRYTGEWSADGEELNGEWELQPMKIQTTDGYVQTNGGHGTWSMRRVSRELSRL